MSARNLVQPETIHHDEGVIATRSAAGVHIRLPRPVSASHQLGMIAVLWELWKAARDDSICEEMEWTIGVSGSDEMTLPLIAILSAIDSELSEAGRRLLVVGDPDTPARAISAV